MWEESHFNAKSLSLLKAFCISNDNSCILYLFVFSVLWSFWGTLGSSVIFDEKYCSATGYNFQTENRSPCNLKETNKKVNTIQCWRKMSQTLMGISWWARWLSPAGTQGSGLDLLESVYNSNQIKRSGRWGVGVEGGGRWQSWDLKCWYFFPFE